MASLYGANTFGGQVPVSANSTINVSGSGDGFDPVTFRFPNGNLAVATINHHVGGANILCAEFATGGSNCLGNYLNDAAVGSLNIGGRATGFSWRWAVSGNRIFYPVTATSDATFNTPGIGCLDFSNNKLEKCYTGTSPRVLKDAAFFQATAAGGADYTQFVGVVSKAGKVCTVWANANNTNASARRNELRIGCVDPLTMDIVSDETFVVSPASALLANSTVGISVNNSSFGAGESHNNVVEQLPGDNWAVSFRQNYRLATAPGINITENAFICLKSNPGNAATTDCNGNPITHTGSVNVAKNTNGTNATTNVPGNYTGQGMGILPSLDATGTVNGVCLEFGNRQCYDTNGNIIPGKLAATSLVFPGNSSSYDVVGLGKPYLLTYTWSWPDTSYCFDWSTNAPCANATAFNANTAYGSKAFVEQGNMCLVTYGHNAVWNLFSIDKTATGGQFTSGGCILNYTPTQRFKITDPSANFCNPQTNVTQWTTVDLRRLPIQSGSVLNFYSSAGTLIATAPVPATTTANSATTVTIPATVDYALYPTLDIELDLNGVNTTSASNAELYTNYITNDGSKPQICYDVKISNCPTNKQSTNSATVSGGSTGTTTITNTNQYLVCNVIDSDGDGIGDDVDIDDDNDGILDTNENANCSTNVATTTNPNPTANTTASGVTIQYTETGTVNTITDPSVGFAGLNPSQGATITYDFSNPVNNLKMWYADLDNREYLKINYYDENNNRISNLVSYISNDVGTTKNISSDANFGLLIDPTNNAGGGNNAAQQYVEVTTAFKVKKVEVTFNATRADGTAYNSTAQTPDIYIKGLCFYGDTDGDGIPDYLDLDSDADGCSDAIEGGANILTSQLVTAGGTVNGGSTSVNQNLCALTSCVNTSGLPQFTILPTGYSNTTGQTVGNSIDSYKNDCIDNDSDNIPDWQDLDDDNDGILDTSECNSPSLSLNDLNLLPGSPGTSTAFVPGTMLIKTNALNYLGNQYDAIVKVISKNTGTGEFALSTSGSTLAILNSNPSTNPYGEFSIEFVPTGTVSTTSTVYTPATIPLVTIELADIDGSSTATLSEVIGYKTAINPSLVVGSSLENLGFLSGGGPSPASAYSYYRDKNVSLGTASGNAATGSEAAKVYLKFSSYTTGTFVFGITGSVTVATPERGASILQRSEYACDTDGDGITDSLDLDSDNDGCLDAIEGDENVTTAQLVTASGTVTVGTGSTASNQNLGNTVNTNGVPTIVNSGGAADIGSDEGQGVGSSADATVNACFCYKPGIADAGNTYPTKHGITALGRAGADNGNWPMERQSAWTVLESKEKGFVVNRVSTTAGLANITNPVEGMMVYDEEADCLKIYTLKQGDSAMAWHCFTTPACPD